jgi:hypothetical protein
MHVKQSKFNLAFYILMILFIASKKGLCGAPMCTYLIV